MDNAEVDYSESIFQLRIDNDDNIIIERKLSTDQSVSGIFLLEDSKKQKRIFIVDPLGLTGNLCDFEEIESRLFNDSDYWQSK